ncbi:MAG: hypothetical protein NTU98_02175 [Bacteroidetes bacterium]|nr:hypothetical protein [Bacteroidota bacterium]
MYNRLKPIKSKENEGKMGVVNLHRKEGGHFEAELGGQYQRILHSGRVKLKYRVKEEFFLIGCLIFAFG